MKFAVVVFPGSNSDYDAFYAATRVLGEQAELVWHKDTDLDGADAVILPGGFSYGDYLRSGAIARFSPVMAAVARFAERGGLVLGICNGFQILLEAGLLPGAMVRNRGLKLRLPTIVPVRVERADTPFTAGCASRAAAARCRSRTARAATSPTPTTLDALEANGQVVFRYVDAGGQVGADGQPERLARATSPASATRPRNVVGLMPHPERAVGAGRSAAPTAAVVLASVVTFVQTPTRAVAGVRRHSSSGPRMTVDRRRSCSPSTASPPDEYERIQQLLGREPTCWSSASSR